MQADDFGYGPAFIGILPNDNKLAGMGYLVILLAIAKHMLA